MKHTKGEWAWQKFGNKYLLTAQHGMREIIIGASTVDREQGYIDCLPTMNDDGILKPINPDRPNAKLIAAAPELLDALQAFVKDISEHPSSAAAEHYAPLIKIAEAAIKKATL